MAREVSVPHIELQLKALLVIAAKVQAGGVLREDVAQARAQGATKLATDGYVATTAEVLVPCPE